MLFNQIFAHEEETEELPAPTLEAQLTDWSFWGIGIASALAIFFIVISLLWKTAGEKAKWVLYLGIAIPVALATLFLAGSTVYINVTSVTGGPVHWHADFEVWACGVQLDLTDPTGIANRVGSPVFHEHGDDRIHVEGVVTNSSDVELGNFFRFVGGELHETHISFPTNEKLYEYDNGDLCPDEVPGILQAFIWKTDVEREEFYQEKLVDPQEYVISPYSTIPPGDCLIIEFGGEKEKTDKLCTFYEIAREKGELKER